MNIKNMTLDEKLGMVLCARRFEEEDMEFILELVPKRALGSVQGHAAEPGPLHRILATADYPIIVVNDAEQGFPTTKLPQIPLNALSACNNPEYCRAFAKGIVNDAKNAGFNATWGPVIDILDCDGPIKVGRTFSDDKERVTNLAEIICSVFADNNFLACGKHFPGSYGLDIDTHMREGVCEFSKEYIIEHNLYPYIKLNEKGLLPTAMVGHTVYKNLDPDYPASISKKTIDIIRDLGFDGVMYTDSFGMMGILQKFGEENIYGMAIAAGNDIILPNYRTPFKKCFELLKKNFEDGLFSEERLDEAVRRVLKAQEIVGAKPQNPTVFTEEDRKMLENVARDCITAVTDGRPAALDKESKKLFVIMTENIFEQPEGYNAEFAVLPWYYPEKIADRIRENFPGAGVEFIPEFSNWNDHERVLSRATAFDEVVAVTFCNTKCYMGTDGLTRRAESWINALSYSDKISAVVHFGNPYALKNIKNVPRRIFGYTIPDSQLHAMDVLAGKTQARGKIPFDIDFD